MNYWATVFLVVALIAGFFAFSGIAAMTIGIATTLFFVFVVLFVLAVLVRLMGGGR